MRPAVALIIPALNEAAAIGPALESLRGLPLEQIIVADNGSTDGTAQVAASRGAQVVCESRRGYGSACLAGIRALAAGIEIVAFMDADGSDDPADLERLLAPIASGEADLVIGSRTLGRREPGSLAPAQEWGNRLATWLLRILHGVRHTDLGPFRAIRRQALARLAMRDPDFGWTIEMQIKAHRHALRVLEVPVNYRRRRLGQSKISGTLRGTILAGAKILWTIFRLSAFRPQPPAER
jgi:glycosyltransferase involved in cell wall biosynthesis